MTFEQHIDEVFEKRTNDAGNAVSNSIIMRIVPVVSVIFIGEFLLLTGTVPPLSGILGATTGVLGLALGAKIWNDRELDSVRHKTFVNLTYGVRRGKSFNDVGALEQAPIELELSA